MILILLFSFAATLVAGDSCCFERQEQELAFHGSTDATGGAEQGALPKCLTCIRCGNVLGFSQSVEAAVFVADFSENFHIYLEPFFPSPDILGLLRPPIS